MVLGYHCTVIINLDLHKKQCKYLIHLYQQILHLYHAMLVGYQVTDCTCSIVKKQLCNFQLPIVDCPVQSSSISNSMMSRKGFSTSVFICFCAFTLQPFFYGRCSSLFNSLACGNGVDTVSGDTNSLGIRPCLTLVAVILTGDSLYRSMYFIY